MKKFRTYLISFTHWAENWRWLLIVTIGLLLFSAEVIEFIELKFLNQPFHLFEVFLYGILISSTGLFLELFVRLNRTYKRTLKVMEYKQNLILDLTLNSTWETLINRLVELPGTIADIDETYFLMSNPVSGKLEIAGHWAGTETEGLAQNDWDPTTLCKKCFDRHANRLHLCRVEYSPGYVYSLEIKNPNLPVTVLKFRTSACLPLPKDEEEIFNNIGDELAVVLQSSLVQKRYSEMQSVEVAMAERRLVSAYVHDQLGQNLAYLHLKLDQLAVNEKMFATKETRKDIKHLREVANDSYEIVRDILKKMQPETIPNLSNLLKEHAIKVSRQANFTLEFKNIGKPMMIPSDAQHAIFYAFHEVLSNVEKHSKASMVKVLVIWGESLLDISVADNGIGFNSELVKKDEHFGLGILQERIANLKGRLMMDSSSDFGTVVSISVPV